MAEHNIFTALSAVMSQVGYVKKQRSVNLNYSFAGEAALIAAIRPELVEQGIVVYVSEVAEITVREYQSKNGGAMTNVTMTGKVTFAHAASGTSITVTARGEGSDSGDKANNKAMTCLYKYALRQTLMIETGDDPDRFQPAPRDAPANGKPAKTETTNETTPEDAELLRAFEWKASTGKQLGSMTMDELIEQEERAKNVSPAKRNETYNKAVAALNIVLKRRRDELAETN